MRGRSRRGTGFTLRRARSICAVDLFEKQPLNECRQGRQIQLTGKVRCVNSLKNCDVLIAVLPQ